MKRKSKDYFQSLILSNVNIDILCTINKQFFLKLLALLYKLIYDIRILNMFTIPTTYCWNFQQAVLLISTQQLIKEDSTHPRVLEMEPYHQMQFDIIPRKLTFANNAPLSPYYDLLLRH